MLACSVADSVLKMFKFNRKKGLLDPQHLFGTQEMITHTAVGSRTTTVWMTVVTPLKMLLNTSCIISRHLELYESLQTEGSSRVCRNVTDGEADDTY